MKGGNIVVACVATAVAGSPFCAYKTRPAALVGGSSLEDWFVRALKGGDGAQWFWWVAMALAVLGFVAGLLLRRFAEPAKKGGGAAALLRQPFVAAILIPVGIATIVLGVNNRMPQVLDGVAWPPFYSQHWLWCSVLAAICAHFVAESLNTGERGFFHFSAPVRVVMICCSPLAVVFGLLVMVGFIGGGLLGGFAVFRLFFGCPVVGAWQGTCIAIFLAAFEGTLFWPAYIPLDPPRLEPPRIDK